MALRTPAPPARGIVKAAKPAEPAHGERPRILARGQARAGGRRGTAPATARFSRAGRAARRVGAANAGPDTAASARGHTETSPRARTTGARFLARRRAHAGGRLHAAAPQRGGGGPQRYESTQREWVPHRHQTPRPRVHKQDTRTIPDRAYPATAMPARAPRANRADTTCADTLHADQHRRKTDQSALVKKHPGDAGPTRKYRTGRTPVNAARRYAAPSAAESQAPDGAQRQAQRIAEAFELVRDVMAERGEDGVVFEPLSARTIIDGAVFRLFDGH